jgi:hypothetical protein
MQRLTLKPSLLVAVSISRSGGVSYAREKLEQTLVGNHEVSVWKTTRDVPDVADVKKADAIASECRRKIAALCYRTAFGWIAPKEKEAELNQAWAEVRARVQQANAEELRTCRLTATCVKGEVVTDDHEAAEAILKDIGAFFAEVMEAINACDVKKIRQAVASMKGVDGLLDPAHSAALKAAVKQVKQVASILHKEVEKKGQEIAAVIKQLDLSPIDAAMVMFIETEAPKAAALSPVVEPAVGELEVPEVERPDDANGHEGAELEGDLAVPVVTEPESAESVV